MFVKKCGAKARTNNYQACRQPAMKNGRCCLHGGKSTGAKTLEGKKKQIEANRKHGFYNSDLQKELKIIRLIKHKVIENLNSLEEHIP